MQKYSAIVLDIDETLVHTFDSNEFPNFSKETFIILKDRYYKFENKLWGITRPHLDEFLDYAFETFDYVIIWSAGTKEYVDFIVKTIFKTKPPHLVLSRLDCDIVNKKCIKNLDKIVNLMPDLRIQDILIIDDKCISFSKNNTNGILIKQYYPNNTDEAVLADETELLKIKDWFTDIDILQYKSLTLANKLNNYILTIK